MVDGRGLEYERKKNMEKLKMDQEQWECLSPEQKKVQLFLQQKELLKQFREHNAITQEQYEKSLTDLTIKMGMTQFA